MKPTIKMKKETVELAKFLKIKTYYPDYDKDKHVPIVKDKDYSDLPFLPYDEKLPEFVSSSLETLINKQLISLGYETMRQTTEKDVAYNIFKDGKEMVGNIQPQSINALAKASYDLIGKEKVK